MRVFIISIFLSCVLSLVSAISAFAKPPASAFGQLPNIYDAAISPDGSKLAAYLNAGDGGYAVVVYYLDGSGTMPLKAGMEAGVKPQWIQWANNDVVLASFWQSSKYRGTPITSGFIYRLDVTTQKGGVLIKPKDVFRQYNNQIIDMLPKDPDHILMSFADINTSAPDVQKVNVRTGRYSRVRRGAESIQDWYTDRTGQVRVGQGLRDKSKEDWRLTIRDADSDKWRSASDYPGLAANETIYAFTSNPNELIIGRYAGKDTLGLYVYDLGQKAVSRKIFHNEEYDVKGVVLNADGSDIVGATYVSDNEEVELFGGREGAIDRLRQKFPGYTVDYVDSTADYKQVVVKLSSASDPGALYVMDSDSLKLRRISYQYDELDIAEMGEVISVRYTSRDGVKIPAYVTIPPSIESTADLKGVPFIILPHGGPYARDSKRFHYLPQFFASRGFGVLQMNFRGSIGYGKEFEEAGRKNWVVMQEDVEDGARWLIEKGYADPSRTCISGWSYGGYAALIGKIKNPDLYACTISMAGVTDLKGLINDLREYRFGRLTSRGFLKGFEDKDDLKENSPAKRAEEMTGPVFLAHGTLDQRVHFDQFKRMKSALKKSDADVTAIEFEDEDHFLSNQDNRIKFFEELDKFLEDAVGVSEFAD